MALWVLSYWKELRALQAKTKLEKTSTDYGFPRLWAVQYLPCDVNKNGINGYRIMSMGNVVPAQVLAAAHFDHT